MNMHCSCINIHPAFTYSFFLQIDFEVKKKNSFSTVKDTVIALDEIIISKTQCSGN